MSYSETPIMYVPTNKLNTYEKNPRRISVEEFEKLKKDLEEDREFFNDRPLLVNRTDGVLTVYAGNQRLQAAKKLGWKEVPCIVRDDLDEDTIRRRMILDNRHRGEWDYDILANEYDTLELLVLGFKEEELFGVVKEVEDIDEESSESQDDGLPCPACGKISKSKK